MSKIIFLFLFLVVITEISCSKSRKWAVILVNTKGWINYRHESNGCRFYQTLVTNGIPKSNIITFLYDDIAGNTKNPKRGVILNHPRGEDVYEDVEIDYNGTDVNVNTFLAVLSGDSSAVKDIGTERVLKSGPNDAVTIYIVGSSVYSQLTFPTGPSLPGNKLVEAFENIYKKNLAKNVLVYLEVPFAESLVDNLSQENRVFVISATLEDEVPWAVFCSPYNRICYGSLMGAILAKHSDRLRQLYYTGRSETVYDQFNALRAETVYSTVNFGGDPSVGKLKLSDFLGYSFKPKPGFKRYFHPLRDSIVIDQDDDSGSNEAKTLTGANKDDVHYAMSHQDAAALMIGSENSENEPSLHDLRKIIDEAVENIVNEISIKNDEITMEKLKQAAPNLSEKSAGCYGEVLHNFQKLCFNINQNGYILDHTRVLAALCSKDIEASDIVNAMQNSCNYYHRSLMNVH